MAHFFLHNFSILLNLVQRLSTTYNSIPLGSTVIVHLEISLQRTSLLIPLSSYEIVFLLFEHFVGAKEGGIEGKTVGSAEIEGSKEGTEDSVGAKDTEGFFVEGNEDIEGLDEVEGSADGITDKEGNMELRTVGTVLGATVGVSEGADDGQLSQVVRHMLKAYVSHITLNFSASFILYNTLQVSSSLTFLKFPINTFLESLQDEVG